MDEYKFTIENKDIMKKGIRALGIDCGIALTGWAVIERLTKIRSKPPNLIDFGVIKTKAGEDMSDRLVLLYKEVIKLIDKYKPDTAAVEGLFYFKNKKTIISVGQARGVILLAIKSKNIQSYDYTPLQVKQAVTGYGKASKKQVQRMVKSILNLKEIPRPDDAADAVAIGICHLNSLNINKFQNKVK